MFFCFFWSCEKEGGSRDPTFRRNIKRVALAHGSIFHAAVRCVRALAAASPVRRFGLKQCANTLAQM